MSIQLGRHDRELVGKCLFACVEGPFFPDEEFQTLFGLTREEVGAVLAAWPDVDLLDAVVSLAVGNAINNLQGYPHGLGDELRLQFDVDDVALDRLAILWFKR